MRAKREPAGVGAPNGLENNLTKNFLSQPVSGSQPRFQKPDILDVIGAHVELRRCGKEFVGRCPFHHDKTPSFTVNESKQVFFCHGCNTGGDVIRFVELIEQTDFKGALKSLSIQNDSERPPSITESRKLAGRRAEVWANKQRATFNVMIADKLEERDLADGLGDFELAEAIDRELVLIRGFYDALEYPSGVAEMLALRVSIEALTDSAEGPL